MKMLITSLGFAALLSSTAFSQQTSKAPILDGYPVVVQSVKYVPATDPNEAAQLMATINYPYGCDTTQALVVVGTFPSYNVYSANDQKRTGAIHCDAFSNEVAQVKVAEFFGNKPDTSLIKVNGITVTK